VRADETVLSSSTRFGLQLAMLNTRFGGDGFGLNWFMAETDALKRAATSPEVQRRRLITEPALGHAPPSRAAG
jgi:hypothetical protein